MRNKLLFCRFLIKTTLPLILVGFSLKTTARKGMWLPPNLRQQEEKMKEAGLQIPVDMLYNEDGTGLNNAVVLFGSGCTGEIISSKGLLLTNHHCGYGTVQGLSSRENDYFANGFWAKSREEELPCPGLKVTFIRKMENVTDKILIDIDDTIPPAQRDIIINTRIKSLEKGYKYATKLNAVIKPFYNGNQYWVILSETFEDVRLVGFPQNSIGNFGGDTDNWMWPRHTGDFSMFRVYAGKDNKPAPYSKDNKPFETKQYFKINTSGYKEGDFTMVYGFPAFTDEYISSFQLSHIYSIIDPVRIEARTKRLEVWNRNMDRSRDVFLQYTSKKARIANGWKKWQGELRGLKMNNVMAIKYNYEKDFQGWAQMDQNLPYADDLLSQMGAKAAAVNDLIMADEYIKEVALGVELIAQAAVLDQVLNIMRTGISGEKLQDTLQKIYAKNRSFYKNYDQETDKEVFAVLMPMFFNQPGKFIPQAFTEQFSQHGNNYRGWAAYVFSSRASDSTAFSQLTSTTNPADSIIIQADPAWQLYNALVKMRTEKITPQLSAYNNAMKDLNRLYMKAQMKLDKTQEFFPDANQTLRLTYGSVKGIDPDGPAGYSYQTNLDEVVAKAATGIEDYVMPEKLKELQLKKDYGKWGINGTQPIAFIATNHTSGGNSGSPVLNAKGELIGTNFDRIWEGTMSDLYFDSRLCRNISVDIRYTLFIIDKIGEAGWLIKEMNIVK